MKRIIPLLLFFIGCYRVESPKEGSYLLLNQDYYPGVKRLIEASKNSIYFCIFVANYKNGSLVEYIYNDLAEAVSRGVDVRVILDSSYYDSSLNAENTAFAESLENIGVNVSFDTPYPTTHAKFGIFDHRTILIGSTNWTMSAMEKNNEANIVLEDKDLASELEDYFMRIWRGND